ncbi:periplasmic heavy metal sensor [Shigella flexneri]
MPDYPSYQRFIVGTEDAIPEVRQPLEGSTIKRNTKIARYSWRFQQWRWYRHLDLPRLYGMWQQNAAPLTSEQDTAARRKSIRFWTLKSSALQQQLVTKRYEYNALLAANPPDSRGKINAVAKEMENLRRR